MPVQYLTPVTLPAAPAAPLEAVTKQYVDEEVIVSAEDPLTAMAMPVRQGQIWIKVSEALPPPPPTAPTVSVDSPTENTISWTPPTDTSDISGYRVTYTIS